MFLFFENTFEPADRLDTETMKKALEITSGRISTHNTVHMAQKNQSFILDQIRDDDLCPNAELVETPDASATETVDRAAYWLNDWARCVVRTGAIVNRVLEELPQWQIQHVYPNLGIMLTTEIEGETAEAIIPWARGVLGNADGDDSCADNFYPSISRAGRGVFWTRDKRGKRLGRECRREAVKQMLRISEILYRIEYDKPDSQFHVISEAEYERFTFG